MGLSGSGKSTKARQLSAETGAVIVSSDEIRATRFGDENTQSFNSEVFELYNHEIKAALMNGYDVIADATNISYNNRRGLIKYVENTHCKLIAVVSFASLEDCIDRNSKRERRVPDYTILKQYNNFQFPSNSEGYDEIRYTV